MGADKNSSRKRLKLQQDECGFQTHVSDSLPKLVKPTLPLECHWTEEPPHTTFRLANAAEHQTSSPLTSTGQTGEGHRSDRSLLVKLGYFH
jgi:hypothetical protein